MPTQKEKARALLEKMKASETIPEDIEERIKKMQDRAKEGKGLSETNNHSS
jgi:hypothetical protein